jgi:branched-chain amino acid transport system ATP-binding protein
VSFLEARNIEKSYGALKVLHGVSLDVAEHEIFAIIGPNGAGKTTLFKVLTGESPANSGTVSYEGVDITGLPAFKRARLGIGRTFQVARVFTEFDLLTNIVIAIETRMRGVGQSIGGWWQWQPTPSVRDEANEILDRFGFTMVARRTEAQHLSHGDRKRLEFAIALAARPRLLMLDEPTAGMSPPDRRTMTLLLARLKAENAVTIVVVEHDMDLIFELADRLMVLNYGEVLALGHPNAVRDDPMVRQVYLGQSLQHAAT